MIGYRRNTANAATSIVAAPRINRIGAIDALEFSIESVHLIPSADSAIGCVNLLRTIRLRRAGKRRFIRYYCAAAGSISAKSNHTGKDI
jgi:hypothetical protein